MKFGNAISEQLFQLRRGLVFSSKLPARIYSPVDIYLARIAQEKMLKNPFLACSLLTSFDPNRPNNSHIKISTDPLKQFQDMNEKKDAKKWKDFYEKKIKSIPEIEVLRKAKPWELTCVVYGFPSKTKALEFESFWKNPLFPDNRFISYDIKILKKVQVVSENETTEKNIIIRANILKFQKYLRKNLFSRVKTNKSVQNDQVKIEKNNNEEEDEEDDYEDYDDHDNAFTGDVKSKNRSKDDITDEKISYGDRVHRLKMRYHSDVKLKLLLEMLTNELSPFRYVLDGLHIRFFGNDIIEFAKNSNISLEKIPNSMYLEIMPLPNHIQHIYPHIFSELKNKKKIIKKKQEKERQQQQ